jgi:hypothetical protein
MNHVEVMKDEDAGYWYLMAGGIAENVHIVIADPPSRKQAFIPIF